MIRSVMMDQYSFNFCEDDPHPMYVELSQQARDALIELMAELIISVNQSAEHKDHNE